MFWENTFLNQFFFLKQGYAGFIFWQGMREAVFFLCVRGEHSYNQHRRKEYGGAIDP